MILGGRWPGLRWALRNIVLTIVVVTIIVNLRSMKDKNQSEGKRRVGSPEESAFLELLRTTDMLSRRFAPLLKAEELSSTQYNVLRILRGAPEGLPCGEIGNRMITRDPDITRLLDRLEKRGLVSRCRETKDRRLVLTRITDKGLEFLARLDEPIQEIHRAQLGHLGRERLQTLVELAQAARSKTG